MPSAEALRSREQRIVAALAEAGLPDRPTKEFRARCRKLPSLVRRHGPLQTLIYLTGKGGEDKEVAELLLKIVRAMDTRGLPGTVPEKATDQMKWFQSISGQSFPERLRVHALCIEVATWIERAVEARFQEEEEERTGKAGGEKK